MVPARRLVGCFEPLIQHPARLFSGLFATHQWRPGATSKLMAPCALVLVCRDRAGSARRRRTGEGDDTGRNGR